MHDSFTIFLTVTQPKKRMQASSQLPAYSPPRPPSGRHRQQSANSLQLSVLRPTPISIACRAISRRIKTKGFGIDMLLRPLLNVEKHAVNLFVCAESEATLEERVVEIRGMLKKMGKGEISMSPYDTAWVAMVRDRDDESKPKFPMSLRWIAEHQLPDGSWGEPGVFEPYDRMLNTLACVTALGSYGTCRRNCERGMAFLRENMHKIGEGDEVHMPIGFEMVFPSLVDMARVMGLDLPFSAPGLKRIYNMRRLKMARIPMAVLHEVPTTVLHSLEGMVGDGEEDLNWEQLLHLRCDDGSFLFSPSSTAFAVARTGDGKSLRYLERLTEQFGGGVPNVYPVDLFEHMWAVDRLQRLGISRYLEAEIDRCLDHVYKNWTDGGIGWASGSVVHDIDDTAMGFRLLRLHGYNVSPDVFRNFESNGEFFCFVGQSSQAVTGMFNLNRAAQVAFQGEEILEEAGRFSSTFLRERRRENQIVDKWVITKDLQGEVDYALDFPWPASLPRVETRIYLEQYGGDADVWIGKTLYRMPLVNNNAYLELAKADFNMCQAVHQKEWLGFLRWFDEVLACQSGMSDRRLLEAYFLAACSVFEQERSAERLGWARTAVLSAVVREYIGGVTSLDETKQEFVQGLRIHEHGNGNGYCRNKRTGALVETICSTLHKISAEAATVFPTKHHNILQCLRQAWVDWIMTVGRRDGDNEALLICRTLELCAGRFHLEQALSSPLLASSTACRRAAAIMSAVCRRLGVDGAALRKMTEGEKYPLMLDMQALIQCVLENSDGGDKDSMSTFLKIAKSFFYVSHCQAETMQIHIEKVLFEPVV